MPRTRSLAWSELKIGVLFIVAILIAAATVFTLTGGRGFFWQRYNLKTRFDNVAGLKGGSPVRVAGVEVGSVDEVTFAGEKVDVLMSVNKSMRPRITSDSVAYLGSVSLLGESAVDITPATSGTPVPDWGYVPQGRQKGSFTDLASTAAQGIDEITGLAKDIRAGRGTVGKLVTDDQFYTEMRQFAASANGVTDAIKRGRGTIGKLVNDPKVADSLEASLRNLDEMTQQINAGKGSIGQLLKDDKFARSLNAATTNLQTLTERLNRGEGTAGKLLTDESLFNRLNSLTERFDSLVTQLNEGQGTAGQLLKDKQLYENMNGAVTDLRTLVSDIRRDPRKYLNVHVSVF
jgi:phospholipid/cholesterol/gamma-HCH transport system substrate-binding protein